MTKKCARERLKKCCEELGFCGKDPSVCLRCPHYYFSYVCKKYPNV